MYDGIDAWYKTWHVMHCINRRRKDDVFTLELLLLLLSLVFLLLESMLGSINVVSVNNAGIEDIGFLSMEVSLWTDAVDELGELSNRKNGSGGRSGESDLQSSVV